MNERSFTDTGNRIMTSFSTTRSMC